jgi:type II secretory pathway component PulM
VKTRWQEMQTKYWHSRSAQERQIIAVAAMLLLPLIYYFLLWQPAHHALNNLHKTLPKLQAQSLKIKEQASAIVALRHQAPLVALDASALKASIEASALRLQIRSSLTTLDTQEPNAVRITCDAISFAAWLSLLRDLQQAQQIRASAISISALPQEGMVKLSATLTNGSTP